MQRPFAILAAVTVFGVSATVGLAPYAAVAADPTIVVTSTLDVVDPADGVTTLREAAQLANANPGPDEISYAPGFSGQIEIESTIRIAPPVSISGPGSDVLSIGGLEDRVFDFMFTTDGHVTVSGLDFYGSGSLVGSPPTMHR